MNKPYEIAEVNDNPSQSCMHNGWDYSEDAKHVVFGDGTGVDIFLCTQEPFEDNDGRTCISACWEPDCNVELSDDQHETLNEFMNDTYVSIEADDGDGAVRDGAWDELVQQAKTESDKLFKEINSTHEPVEELSEDELQLRRLVNEMNTRKVAVMNELKNGEKHDFYVNCLKNDCAFDVEADGTKYEICPWRYHYLNGGAEAVYSGVGSEMNVPFIDEDEILDLIKSAA